MKGAADKSSAFAVCVNKASGPVCTERQRQRCDNSVMTLAILFSLKTVESLENVTYPNPSFSSRTHSVNAVVKFVVKFKFTYNLY